MICISVCVPMSPAPQKRPVSTPSPLPWGQRHASPSHLLQRHLLCVEHYDPEHPLSAGGCGEAARIADVALVGWQQLLQVKLGPTTKE